MPEPVDLMKQGLNIAIKFCHEKSIKTGFWSDPRTGQRIRRNKGELISIMHHELSACLEGERKSSMDSDLPFRRSAEVELSDLLLRVFDYAGEYGYDLAGALSERLLCAERGKK